MIAFGFDSDIRPGNLRPGNLRPGNLRPGNLRPGNLRPGNLRPGNPRPEYNRLLYESLFELKNNNHSSTSHIWITASLNGFKGKNFYGPAFLRLSPFCFRKDWKLVMIDKHSSGWAVSEHRVPGK